MFQKQQEIEGKPGFVTTFTDGHGGIFAWVGWEGSAGLSSGPFPTREAAREWAAKIVREVLRTRIEASGIGRRGERPAFREGFGDAGLYLEGEEPCKTCGHLEGDHRIDGCCTHGHRVVPVEAHNPWAPPPCACEWFEPAAELEQGGVR